jgi:hypothetical protein
MTLMRVKQPSGQQELKMRRRAIQNIQRLTAEKSQISWTIGPERLRHNRERMTGQKEQKLLVSGVKSQRGIERGTERPVRGMGIDRLLHSKEEIDSGAMLNEDPLRTTRRARGIDRISQVSGRGDKRQIRGREARHEWPSHI